MALTVIVAVSFLIPAQNYLDSWHICPYSCLQMISIYCFLIKLKIQFLFEIASTQIAWNFIFWQQISFAKGQYNWSIKHKQWRIQDFPEEGRQPPKWGRLPIIWSKISWKLHENERIRTPEGGRASLAPPPLRSANVNFTWFFLAFSPGLRYMH